MLGNGLPEDERSWAFDFRVLTPTAWWRVPVQTLMAGLPGDARAQYRIHKMMLMSNMCAMYLALRPPAQRGGKVNWMPLSVSNA
jgi:hypothetical protein